MKPNKALKKRQDNTIVVKQPEESWAIRAEREAFINYPGSDQWEQRLIHKLYNYFSQPDKLTLDQYCRDNFIFRDTLHSWQEKYPDVREAVNRIKIFIADNRRQGTYNNQLNPLTFRDSFLYDPEA